jgi:hypothetical protein
MAETGAAHDLRHAGLVKPVVREAGECCIEYLLAALVAPELADLWHGTHIKTD